MRPTSSSPLSAIVTEAGTPSAGDHELEVLAQRRRGRARFLGGLRLLRRVAAQLGRNASGREADAEEAPLPFRDDLEAHLALVEPGEAALELPQRRPLGLAHRLAGPLDLTVSTVSPGRSVSAVLIVWSAGRASCAGARGGRRLEAGFGAGAAAPSPAGVRRSGRASAAGVRELRFGGGCGLGMSRRVTSPWPTVQRFVVTQ